MNKNEWRVSLNNKLITPEFNLILSQMFERLAALNCKILQGQTLTQPEQFECNLLSKLHDNFRLGKGLWSPLVGKNLDESE